MRLLSHSCMFFSKVLTQVFAHFLCSCLFIVKLQETFIYSGWQSTARCMHCGYFLPVCGSLNPAKTCFWQSWNKLLYNHRSPAAGGKKVGGEWISPEDTAPRCAPMPDIWWYQGWEFPLFIWGPESVHRSSYPLGTWMASQGHGHLGQGQGSHQQQHFLGEGRRAKIHVHTRPCICAHVSM